MVQISVKHQQKIMTIHVWKRLHFSSMWLLLSGRPLGGLPEGVSEVNAPSLELLRVVGGHVGEFSEDVEVCGVS